MNFSGRSVEGIINFDSQCATFTFYTFILITSLYIVREARIFKSIISFPTINQRSCVARATEVFML